MKHSQQEREIEGEPVYLFVYDLSQGLARQLSPSLLNKQIDGIWHTGIVVFGREYAFGAGIETLSPGSNHYGNPVDKILMGYTQIPRDLVLEFIDSLQAVWTPQRYHLLDNNCNNFSNEVCQFLVGKTIPAHITGLPAEFLNTPLGQMIKPMIESMSRPHAFQSSQSSQSSTGPVSLTTLSQISKVRHLTSLNDLEMLISRHDCVVVDFTNTAGCPPCRVISPEFERMIEELNSTHTSRGVFLPNPVVVGVSVEIQQAMGIAQKFQISATPTFMFFHRGSKFHEFKGANVAELQSSLDLLVYTAFPPHPHNKIQIPSLVQLIKTEPIHFIASSKVDLIVQKLKTLSSHADSSILQDVGAWLQSDKQSSLPKGWSVFFSKMLVDLDDASLFPAVDLIRLLILYSPEAQKFYSHDNGLGKVMERLASSSHPNDVLVRKGSMMIQRALCNLFSKDSEMKFLSDSNLRSSMLALIIESLLTQDSQLKHTAALLAYNIGWSSTRLRDSSLNEASMAELEGYHSELVAALCQALEGQWDASNDDFLLRLVSCLGFLLAFAPLSVIELAQVVELKDKLDVISKQCHAWIKNEKRDLVLAVIQEVNSLIQ